jgi:2-polyprenyl-3-methyl-5-hydroxy-6-metoxy-1,4-benzoquinol methylase
MGRLRFALWSLGARFRPGHNQCPYCASIFHVRLQRKKLVIEARKCQYCGLIFRWPVDSPTKAERFYEHEYRSGIVTELPSAQEVARLRARAFEGSGHERARYTDLVRSVAAAPARVLDFGASWGYIGCQLEAAGYEVEGFEVSRTRAEFGREHLRLPIYSSWKELDERPLPRFDVVFTAHTLEHTFDLWAALERLAEAVVPGGALVAVVPNGGGREARRRGVGWTPYIGETHTIALTADWFRQNLPRHGFAPQDLFSLEADGRDPSCDGDELVCIARARGVAPPAPPAPPAGGGGPHP